MITAQEAKQMSIKAKGFDSLESSLQSIEKEIKEKAEKSKLWCHIDKRFIQKFYEEICKVLQEKNYKIREDLYEICISWE